MSDTTRPVEFQLRDYWAVLTRRRWLVLFATLAAVAAGALHSLVATPTFRAETTIAIERSGARVVKQDLVSVESSWVDYQNFYNTQYRIIESNTVLSAAAAAMRLDQARPRRESPGLWARLSAAAFGAPAPTADPISEATQVLRSGLKVEPIRDSHLVRIAFVSPDPAFAAAAANAIAAAYRDHTLSMKQILARQSQTFVLDQIARLRSEIVQDEAASQQFAREHGLVTGDANDAAMRNFEDLRLRLTQIEAEVVQAKARWETGRDSAPESLSEVRQSPLIQSLGGSIAEAERDFREKAETFGSAYPDVQKLRARLDALRDKRAQETAAIARRSVEAARNEYETALRQQAEVSALVEREKSKVDRFRGAYADYTILTKTVEAKRATLHDLLDRQNDLTLTGNLNDTGHNVWVVDEAEVPEKRYRPRPRLDLLLGLLAGMVLGVSGAFVVEYIDDTLKTPDDVRPALALPVLGMIPLKSGPPGVSRRLRSVRRRRGGPSTVSEPPRGRMPPSLVTLLAPLSPESEAYRELRTSLLLSTPEHPPRDVTITSCQAKEGKTTTAVNLAVTNAQLGRRVLVVDADLRRPRCHRVLRVPGQPGLSDYLAGAVPLDGLVVPTLAPGVHLLPAGRLAPNPAELLDGERFRELVERLRALGEFDLVIYDSPPVMSVVDALLIGRLTEGTLLVVRSGVTSRASGRVGRDKLVAGRSNLLGVLLNAVDDQLMPEHYRQYRYARPVARDAKGDAAPAPAPAVRDDVGKTA